ncbi:phage holin [Terribacillus sp. 7520-G]|uniref:phage holin n=1 Tax=Terribacillus sp. 7520-G TaxID=2025389 RepID=UPI000BA7694E|nr:phage holin [Terribacillus sp. 7520-G]PAD39829.1 phage holin [Terribacillus sp. 7520-G]
MDKGTIIRSVVLILALINQLLMANGLTPIPGTEDAWGEILATIFTAVISAWTFFKNNFITPKGQKQKEVLQREGLTKAK